MVIGMSNWSPNAEDVRAHLSMMQSVITRMAENSRACKTWAVTLVAAILLVVARFGTSSGEPAFGPEAALIALVPTILFWMLDSYYLALERVFRNSYNSFVERLHTGKLETGEVFKIAPSGSVPKTFFSVQKSFSIWPFYPALVVVIIAFIIVSG